MRYAMDPEQHAAIFGPRDPMDAGGPGRFRRCRSCGGWHERGKVPHNCRPPAPPRNPNLHTPQVAPGFAPFLASQQGREVISTRAERRDYMERHDLVDYDEGVRKEGEHWTEERAEIDTIKRTMAEFRQTDTDYLSNIAGFDVTNPERVDDTGSLDEGTEIETDGMDIADGQGA